jgi:hypothetical protein
VSPDTKNTTMVSNHSSHYPTGSPPIVYNRCHAITHLALDLGLWGAAPDALGLRALQVLGRDPARVIGLGTGSGNGGAVGAENGNLLGWVDLLGAAGGLLRALTALAAAPLLRKEGRDPGIVDEVDSAAESAEEHEVEENARTGGQQSVPRGELRAKAMGRAPTFAGRRCWSAPPQR